MVEGGTVSEVLTVDCGQEQSFLKTDSEPR